MSAAFSARSAPLAGLNLIEASAGTGKTWTIAALYARLVLEQDLRPEQMLVVTYTKAATAELRGRIRARLAELADVLERWPEPAFRARLSQTDPHFLAPLLASRTDPATDARRLRLAVSAFDTAAVFTIHSFCQRALGEHSLQAGLELEREFVADEAELLQQVADAAWKAEIASASPGWLNWLVAQGHTPDGWVQTLRPYLGQPGLQLALPAATDLAAREARYLAVYEEARHRWHSEGQAALDWLQARSAAGEFKGSHRRDWLLGSIALWHDWLDGNGTPALKEDEKSPGQAETKVRRLYERELREALKSPTAVPPLFALFEPLADAALALQQAYAGQLAQLYARLITELATRLADRKAALGVMSFHDLLVELDTALAHDGGDALRQALRSRYRAALIDEFQDTDPLQYRIFSALFGDGALPTFLVGDPKQAIYAFRGAELNAYLAAKAGVAPERCYSLDTNRRSTPALVQSVSQLFAQAPRPFLLDGLDYPEVGALPDKPTLCIDHAPQPALGWQWLGDAPLGKGEAGQLAVQAAADRIAALLALGAAGRATLGDKPVNGGDIAVLGSSHKELQAMQQALAERGVASVRISRQSVFDTDEARDLLQVLAALIAPSERSVRAALATPLLGLDADSLYGLLHDEAAWDAVLADYRRWHGLLQQRSTMAALLAWLHDSGTAARLITQRDGERRLANVLHLFELIELARHEKPGLGPLLAWYRQELAGDTASEDDARLMRLESDAQRVKLVTIHASKGLEYPIVFCPWLWDGKLFQQSERWPLCREGDHNVLDLGSQEQGRRWAQAEQERLAEKLRLLYVALTRPKSACYIAWGEVKELDTSALGWLLAGGERRLRPAATLQAEIETLIAAAPDATGWTMPLPPVPPQRDSALPPAVQIARLDRRLYWQWRMSSFSGLTAGLHEEAPDHDAIAASITSPPLEPGRFDGFPAGPRAGVCLHSLFEEWDFARDDRTALEQLASEQLQAHGFDRGWAGMAADMVETALDTPLTESGAPLKGLPAAHRLVELEFTFALQPFAWPKLARLLADPAHGLPPTFAQAAANLNSEIGSGYLKGFIDLTCQLDGRHYILDWKSNRLDDYGPTGLEAAMAGEHYYLQALIYCVALHRYLKWRKASYDYDRDFGGGLYLFLRGLPEGGVWRYRPPLVLITQLETLLCGASI